MRIILKAKDIMIHLADCPSFDNLEVLVNTYEKIGKFSEYNVNVFKAQELKDFVYHYVETYGTHTPRYMWQAVELAYMVNPEAVFEFDHIWAFTEFINTMKKLKYKEIVSQLQAYREWVDENKDKLPKEPKGSILDLLWGGK